MSNLVLVNKDNNKIYDIYDIKYDKAGYPHFLIYKDNQWISMSAKHFRPADADDYKHLFDEQLLQKYSTSTEVL